MVMETLAALGAAVGFVVLIALVAGAVNLIDRWWGSRPGGQDE